MYFDLSRQQTINAIHNIGWISLPNHEHDLLRQRQKRPTGDSEITFLVKPAISIAGRGFGSAQNVNVDLQEAAIFLCPRGQSDVTYMVYNRQRFYETWTLKDGAEVTPHFYDDGIARAITLADRASESLQINTLYPFPKIYARTPPGRPPGKPINNILSPHLP